MCTKVSNRAIEKLLETMQSLRSPNGCPWDMEQTPKSLVPYILEEACELIDAIESEDINQIKDELGDLLLQVVFQAQLFNEQGYFEFNDVAESINNKLIRRHPHVFNPDGKSRNQKELDQQWEAIKRREILSKKVHNGCIGLIPSRLPSLQFAQKIINRAMRSGLESKLPDNSKTEVSLTTSKLNSDTLGQIFLQLIIMAQKVGLDAEQSLRMATRKLQVELNNSPD